MDELLHGLVILGYYLTLLLLSSTCTLFVIVQVYRLVMGETDMYKYKREMRKYKILFFISVFTTLMFIFLTTDQFIGVYEMY